MICPMPIADLLTKFKATKAVIPSRFLAIEITPETVKSAVWQVVNAKTHVVTMGEIKEWDGQEASLLTAVDESLSVALESIETEPNQAVLGLPDSWINGTAINEESKKLLKSLATKLELKFMGFVVASEAIVHDIKRQEGTPLTAIILTITETEVNVQVVHLGKILGLELVGRSEDIGTDVEEGLARMKLTEALPARMILTDGHLDLEAVRQNLLSYDWKGRLNFLHVPKIDILDREFSIKAVAQAGGAEAAKSLGLEVETEAAELYGAPGFEKERDVAEVEIKAEPVPELKPEVEFTSEPEPELKQPPKLIQKIKGIRLPRIAALGWWRVGMLPIIGAIAGFLVVIAILLAIYWTKAEATVVIYVAPQTLEQEINLIADPNAQTIDVGNGVIPARELETEVQGGLEMESSGEALVGDKAKGSVTIYNKTSQAKTFSKGTALAGPKELKFTLDEEVAVASSSSTTEGITFGKADVSVTAEQIGTESNLDPGTEFSITSFAASSYSAKNGASLSGGTAKTARVVAKADQEKLTDDLKLKLIGEARDELKAGLSTAEIVLDVPVSEEVVKQQFSKAVGEEAEKLSLAMQLKLTMFAVKQTDLTTVLLSRLQETVPENFSVEPNSTNLEIKSVTPEEDKTAFLAQAKLALMPKYDEAEIKTRIAGRYPKVVQEYFATLANFKRAEIIMSPKLPARLSTLPRRTEKIQIEIRIAPE